MSERAFGAFWDGSPLGPYERLSLASFAASGASTDLYTYSLDLEVPNGVTVRDAREVVSEERMRTFPGGITHFSNHFRYRMLERRSVVWFDTDLVLLDASQIPRSTKVFGLQHDGLVNTALLGLPAGSDPVQTLVERSDVPNGTRLRWGSLGPRLLTEVLDDAGLLDDALPPQKLYPLAGDQIYRAFEKDERATSSAAVKGAATLHLWNQYLKKLGLKERAPARGSLLDDLAERFGVTFDLPRIDDGDARAASIAKFGRTTFSRRAGDRLRRVAHRMRSHTRRP